MLYPGVVLEANCPERLGGAAVMLEATEQVRENLLRVWVDQGFSGENFARVISQLSSAEVEVICLTSSGFEVLPRWIVERTFAWWNQYRRLTNGTLKLFKPKHSQTSLCERQIRRYAYLASVQNETLLRYGKPPKLQ